MSISTNHTNGIIIGLVILAVVAFIVGLHHVMTIEIIETRVPLLRDAGCYWNCKHIDATVIGCTKQDDNKVIVVCKNNKEELTAINFEVK